MATTVRPPDGEYFGSIKVEHYHHKLKVALEFMDDGVIRGTGRDTRKKGPARFDIFPDSNWRLDRTRLKVTIHLKHEGEGQGVILEGEWQLSESRCPCLMGHWRWANLEQYASTGWSLYPAMKMSSKRKDKMVHDLVLFKKPKLEDQGDEIGDKNGRGGEHSDRCDSDHDDESLEADSAPAGKDAVILSTLVSQPKQGHVIRPLADRELARKNGLREGGINVGTEDDMDGAQVSTRVAHHGEPHPKSPRGRDGGRENRVGKCGANLVELVGKHILRLGDQLRLQSVDPIFLDVGEVVQSPFACRPCVLQTVTHHEFGVLKRRITLDTFAQGRPILEAVQVRRDGSWVTLANLLSSSQERYPLPTQAVVRHGQGAAAHTSHAVLRLTDEISRALERSPIYKQSGGISNTLRIALQNLQLALQGRCQPSRIIMLGPSRVGKVFLLNCLLSLTFPNQGPYCSATNHNEDAHATPTKSGFSRVYEDMRASEEEWKTCVRSFWELPNGKWEPFLLPSRNGHHTGISQPIKLKFAPLLHLEVVYLSKEEFISQFDILCQPLPQNGWRDSRIDIHMLRRKLRRVCQEVGVHLDDQPLHADALNALVERWGVMRNKWGQREVFKGDGLDVNCDRWFLRAVLHSFMGLPAPGDCEGLQTDCIKECANLALAVATMEVGVPGSLLSESNGELLTVPEVCFADPLKRSLVHDFMAQCHMAILVTDIDLSQGSSRVIQELLHSGLPNRMLLDPVNHHIAVWHCREREFWGDYCKATDLLRADEMHLDQIRCLRSLTTLRDTVLGPANSALLCGEQCSEGEMQEILGCVQTLAVYPKLYASLQAWQRHCKCELTAQQQMIAAASNGAAMVRLAGPLSDRSVPGKAQRVAHVLLPAFLLHARASADAHQRHARQLDRVCDHITREFSRPTLEMLLQVDCWAQEPSPPPVDSPTGDPDFLGGPKLDAAAFTSAVDAQERLHETYRLETSGIGTSHAQRLLAAVQPLRRVVHEHLRRVAEQAMELVDGDLAPLLAATFALLLDNTAETCALQPWLTDVCRARFRAVAPALAQDLRGVVNTDSGAADGGERVLRKWQRRLQQETASALATGLSTSFAARVQEQVGLVRGSGPAEASAPAPALQPLARVSAELQRRLAHVAVPSALQRGSFMPVMRTMARMPHADPGPRWLQFATPDLGAARPAAAYSVLGPARLLRQYHRGSAAAAGGVALCAIRDTGHPCAGQFGAFCVARGGLEVGTAVGVYGGDVERLEGPGPHPQVAGAPVVWARVDATCAGTALSFANDYRGIACAPNIALARAPVPHPVTGLPQLPVHTLRAVAYGEELLLDYGVAYWAAVAPSRLLRPAPMARGSHVVFNERALPFPVAYQPALGWDACPIAVLRRVAQPRPMSRVALTQGRAVATGNIEAGTELGAVGGRLLSRADVEALGAVPLVALGSEPCRGPVVGLLPENEVRGFRLVDEAGSTALRPAWGRDGAMHLVVVAQRTIHAGDWLSLCRTQEALPDPLEEDET